MLPTSSEARKAIPLYEALFGYFPNALVGIAEQSAAGNAKHSGPNTPLTWKFYKSDDHADCLLRHQLEYDKIDPETGFYHAAAVAWRALAQYERLLIEEHGCSPGRNVDMSPPERASGD